jgi:hypothetical protein
MSDVYVDPGLGTATINAADDYILRAPIHGNVCRWAIGLVSASFSGSITIKGRPAGSSGAFAAIPYIKLHLNGSVGDGTVVSTAITGTSLIQVDATGLDIDVDCTSFTSGSMGLFASPVVG